MRLWISAALFFGAAVTAAPAGECPVAEIEAALSVPLDGMKMSEREMTDIQSTEGGVWRVYQEPGGRLHSIMRIDGGESGMGERRLSIVNDGAFGITVTRVDYLRHAFIEEGGPNGTAKRTTEYFYFCGGKLHLPPADYATPDLAAYSAAGQGAMDTMVRDKDVADLTKGLAR